MKEVAGDASLRSFETESNSTSIERRSKNRPKFENKQEVDNLETYTELYFKCNHCKLKTKRKENLKH